MPVGQHLATAPFAPGVALCFFPSRGQRLAVLVGLLAPTVFVGRALSAPLAALVALLEQAVSAVQVHCAELAWQILTELTFHPECSF